MKTAAEVIAMANDSNVELRAFRAEARNILGDSCPLNKAEIVAALSALDGNQTIKAEDGEKLIEVIVLRKYAPMGGYEVEEEGEWNSYNQVGDDDVKLTVAPGRIVKLAKAEARRAVKLGIAQVTDRTFD